MKPNDHFPAYPDPAPGTELFNRHYENDGEPSIPDPEVVDAAISERREPLLRVVEEDDRVYRQGV